MKPIQRISIMTAVLAGILLPVVAAAQHSKGDHIRGRYGHTGRGR